MSIMSWIGFGLAVFGIIFLWREHNIIRDSQITYGKVIDLMTSRSAKGGTTYTPRVRFVTLNGREIIFQTQMSSPNPGVSIGETVKVAYRDENPEKARLLSFGYTFAFWYCTIGMGLLLMFVSC